MQKVGLWIFVFCFFKTNEFAISFQKHFKCISNYHKFNRVNTAHCWIIFSLCRTQEYSWISDLMDKYQTEQSKLFSSSVYLVDIWFYFTLGQRYWWKIDGYTDRELELGSISWEFFRICVTLRTYREPPPCSSSVPLSHKTV